MDCSYLCVSVLGLFVIYKLLDRILRIPYIGRNTDRYIFVTGCDSGFGNALVKRLDSLGCHVFAGCLTEKGETELKKTCSDRVQTISLDITKPESVRKAFDVVSRTVADKGKGLWAVVNNAGIVGKIGPHEWIQSDDYRKVCDVNLFGYIDVTMTFLPLIKRSRGRVINVASGAGRCVVPMLTPYSVSKYGVEAFSDGLRRSLRPYGCRVSIVEPGFFKTSMGQPSAIEANVEATWKATTDEIKREFGQEYYQFLHSDFAGLIEKASSKDLSPVVDAFVQAILGQFPRARYQPGLDSKALVVIASFPEWISDRLISLIAPCGPLPAALKTGSQ